MTANTHNPIAAVDPAAARTAAAVLPRVRVALEYAVEGDLRFISHRDEMRVLGRALVRAGWPLRYSQGFNPAPYLSIALPRSTGMASLCQLAFVDLSEHPADGGLLAERLAATLPTTMPLQRLIVDDVPRSLYPRLVTYECALPPDQAALLAGRLPEQAIASEPLYVERARVSLKRPQGKGRPAPAIDARPFIDALEFSDGVLRLRLRFDGERSARPIDILKALGLSAEECGHRLRRVGVVWNTVLAGREFGPAETSERAAQASAALTNCAAQASATPLAGSDFTPRTYRQEDFR